MDAVGILMKVFQEYLTTARRRMQCGLPCRRVKRLWVSRLLVLSLLLTCFLGCYATVGTAGVRLRLRIAAVGADGHPRPNLSIWYTDHELSCRVRYLQALAPICTTDTMGKCSATISYTYSVHYYPWSHPSASKYTSAMRFELSTITHGKRTSLGFLPPLSTEYLSGYREIFFHARLDQAPILQDPSSGGWNHGDDHVSLLILQVISNADTQLPPLTAISLLSWSML